MIDSSMILKATFEKIIESINIGIFDLRGFKLDIVSGNIKTFGNRLSELSGMTRHA